MAEQPAAAAEGHADARAAADALVQAMLIRPLSPVEPVRRSDVWQDPVATLVSVLPSWPRPAAATAASEPAVNDSVASASPSEPEVLQPAAADPGPVVSPAAPSGAGKAARYPTWAAWLTAGLGLAILLAAGGVLTSPFRVSKTYKPEPGCMHCTKP